MRFSVFYKLLAYESRTSGENSVARASDRDFSIDLTRRVAFPRADRIANTVASRIVSRKRLLRAREGGNSRANHGNLLLFNAQVHSVHYLVACISPPLRDNGQLRPVVVVPRTKTILVSQTAGGFAAPMRTRRVTLLFLSPAFAIKLQKLNFTNLCVLGRLSRDAVLACQLLARLDARHVLIGCAKTSR